MSQKLVTDFKNCAHFMKQFA